MKVSLILYYLLGKHEETLEVSIDVEKIHTGKCLHRFAGIYAYYRSRYSNLFLNAYIKMPCACRIIKNDLIL